MGLLIVIAIVILIVVLLFLANRGHDLDDLAQRRVQFNDYLRQKELLDKQASELNQRRDDQDSRQKLSELDRTLKELTDLIKKNQTYKP